MISNYLLCNDLFPSKKTYFFALDGFLVEKNWLPFLRSQEMCILLNDAWELLSDPEKRKDYDAQIELPVEDWWLKIPSGVIKHG